MKKSQSVNWLLGLSRKPNRYFFITVKFRLPECYRTNVDLNIPLWK